MRADRGFTLLEVLIAFLIAALALAALTRGAGGGLSAARIAAHTQDALSRARSRLAGLATSLRPGEQSGDDGGRFTWRTQVMPIATAAAPRPDAPPRPGRPILYAVAVTIAWSADGPGRNVTLASERVSLAPPEPP